MNQAYHFLEAIRILPSSCSHVLLCHGIELFGLTLKLHRGAIVSKLLAICFGDFGTEHRQRILDAELAHDRKVFHSPLQGMLLWILGCRKFSFLALLLVSGQRRNFFIQCRSFGASLVQFQLEFMVCLELGRSAPLTTA